MMDNKSNHAFRVTSRNCDPAFSNPLWSAGQKSPYNANVVDATVRTGNATLQATFQSNIPATNSQSEPTPILQAVNDYGLVLTSNAVVPAFLPDKNEPDYQEAGALVSPFFYKDQPKLAAQSEMTFFVQPSLTETTLRQWNGWAVPYVLKEAPPIVLGNVPLLTQVPKPVIPINPGDPAFSLYSMLPQIDWATNPVTVISYGDTAIGSGGGFNVSVNAVQLSAGVQSPSITSMLAGGLAGANPGQILVGGRGLNTGQLQVINAAQTSAAADLAMKTSIAALRQTGGQ
jgi:hypothetical protein